MQAICSPALLQPNSRPFIVTQQTTNIKGIVQWHIPRRWFHPDKSIHLCNDVARK